MRNQALYDLEQALPGHVIASGLLTDELQSNTIGASAGVRLTAGFTFQDLVNARILPEQNYGGSDNPLTGDAYTALQHVRADINQALGAVAVYDTGRATVGDPKILRAELFALQGYTELLLADLFCSGVPLSTFDFQRDYTYHTSSTTAEVYRDAVTQEDSALALADTSTRIQDLARVLKGRALLSLDSVAAAAQMVASVPDGFQYDLAVNFNAKNPYSTVDNFLNRAATVADTEGKNGLPYLSSHDARTTAAVAITPSSNIYVPLTFPDKYSYSAFRPFVVADWVEARLMQAEAAVRAGAPATAVGLLNQLRATASVTGETAQPPDTLTDPGTDSARVAQVFRERAYWLFLTGQRQGDLRRLLRQYNQWFRSQDKVYPAGAYAGLGTSTYGTDVTAPIPGTEYLNPLFHGCLDRNP